LFYLPVSFSRAAKSTFIAIAQTNQAIGGSKQAIKFRLPYWRPSCED
jgi:hypothetical protein